MDAVFEQEFFQASHPAVSGLVVVEARASDSPSTLNSYAHKKSPRNVQGLSERNICQWGSRAIYSVLIALAPQEYYMDDHSDRDKDLCVAGKGSPRSSVKASPSSQLLVQNTVTSDYLLKRISPCFLSQETSFFEVAQASALGV